MLKLSRQITPRTVALLAALVMSIVAFGVIRSFGPHAGRDYFRYLHRTGPGDLQSPYSLSYARPSTPNFGGDPVDYYRAALENARRGDGKSLYELGMLQGACGHPPADMTLEEAMKAHRQWLKKALEEGRINDGMAAAMDERARVCFGVWPFLPEEPIDWFAKAREAGYPLALLSAERRAVRLRRMAPAKLNPLLGATVATKSPEAMFWASTLYIGSDPAQKMKSATWHHLSCEYQDFCNPAIDERNLRRRFHTYQVVQILDAARRLKEQIESGEIVHHDFYL